MFFSPIVLAFILLGVAVCLFAFWKGGAAERLAAVIVLVNIVLDPVAAVALSPGAESIFRLTSDGLAAMGMLAITLRYASPWLGAVMLCYGAQFTLHSYYFVTDRPKNDDLHAVINNLNFGGIVLCLFIATVVVWSRRSRAAVAAG